MSKGGLAFLHKKSWHTGTIQNAEKVWLAEQRAEGEKKKLAELQKQLAEERELADFKNLQYQSGLISKPLTERIDWMYDGGSRLTKQEEEKAAEAYLLGKPIEEKTGTQEVKSLGSAQTPGSLFLPQNLNSANEMFVKLREDPMFSIRQEELKIRKDILTNPVKMTKIKKEIESLRKKDSKKKKKHKKDRKHSKKRKRDSSSSSSSSSSESESDRKSKPSSSRHHDTRDSRDSHDSRSRDDSRRHRDRDRDRDNEDRHKDSRDRTDSRSHHPAEKGYGLQLNQKHQRTDDTRPSSSSSSTKHLGPPVELLKKKEEERRAEEEAKKRRYSGKSVHQMTAEEREAKVREMETAAHQHEDERLQRIREAEERDRQVDADSKARVSGQKPDFIKTMTKGVFDGDLSVADKVQRQAHYRDRNVMKSDHNSFRR